MSLKKFIRKVCVQPAVYWEFDKPDAFGSPIFKAPVQRFVRWDEKTSLISDSTGKEFLSMAEIITPEDMKEQSYIVLGDIDDLPVDPDPREHDGFEIKKMNRHPLFRSKTLDVFIAYLGK